MIKCTTLLLMTLAACSDRTAVQSRTNSSTSAPHDSAFAQLQARGHRAMGVDQYTSTHQFESLPDGGRISLVRDTDDAAGVMEIRRHMDDISADFQRGDFTVPGFVHDRPVPGTAIMEERQFRIQYTVDTIPGGGSLRLRSRDSVAIAGIHQFLAFQRQEHRAPHGGSSH